MAPTSFSLQRSLFSSDPARVCTIAGSDSGGGAGIQADLKTIQALGGYGLSVLTALTAQNTQGVQNILQVSPEFVKQQLQSVTEDIAIDAFKVGMLANQEVAEAVAEALRSRPDIMLGSAGAHVEPRLTPVVLDPVMVSSSGSVLLKPDAIDTVLHKIIPQCALVTPNLPEASAILRAYGQAIPEGLPEPTASGFARAPVNSETGSTSGIEPQSAAMMHAAQAIASCSGAAAVLVKGGHSTFSQSDVQNLLDHLGLRPVVHSARVFGAVNDAPSGPSRNLLNDTEGVDTCAYIRCLSQDEAEVSVVRTDLRPWSTVLTPQRASPAQGLNAAPDVQVARVVADVLCEVDADAGDKMYKFTIVIKPLVHTAATHGTGCTLSSAVATHLAAGCSLRRAVLLGIEYVQGSLLHGLDQVGHGAHPLNHSHALVSRPVARRRLDRLPQASPSGLPESFVQENKEVNLAHLSALRPLTSHLVGSGLKEWTQFVHHPFVEELGKGTLSLLAFTHFLCQDYLFLRHYANIWSLIASKAEDFDLIKNLTSRSLAMAEEAELHIKYCAKWGISRAQLEHDTTESRATLAYTRFVLDVGRRHAIPEILVSTLPCMLGYAEVGRNLSVAYPKAREQGNSFADWIEMYADDQFQHDALTAVDLLEDLVEKEVIAPARLLALKEIFHCAVKLEQAMWDEAIAVSRGELVL